MRKNRHRPINRQIARIASQGRFAGGVFGLVFFGLGLTILIFLWSADGFGAPPLFFRVFGSFIAIAFLAVGGSLALASIRGRTLLDETLDAARGDEDRTSELGDVESGANYGCEACGAPLSAEADISPLGDVKCTYCKAWFNVRGR